jgi:hypothetical protein
MLDFNRYRAARELAALLRPGGRAVAQLSQAIPTPRPNGATGCQEQTVRTAGGHCRGISHRRNLDGHVTIRGLSVAESTDRPKAEGKRASRLRETPHRPGV